KPSLAERIVEEVGVIPTGTCRCKRAPMYTIRGCADVAALSFRVAAIQLAMLEMFGIPFPKISEHFETLIRVGARLIEPNTITIALIRINARQDPICSGFNVQIRANPPNSVFAEGVCRAIEPPSVVPHFIEAIFRVVKYATVEWAGDGAVAIVHLERGFWLQDGRCVMHVRFMKCAVHGCARDQVIVDEQLAAHIDSNCCIA